MLPIKVHAILSNELEQGNKAPLFAVPLEDDVRELCQGDDGNTHATAVPAIPAFLKHILAQPVVYHDPEGKAATSSFQSDPLSPTQPVRAAPAHGRRSNAGASVSSSQTASVDADASVRGRRRAAAGRHKTAADVLTDVGLWSDDIRARRLFEHVEGKMDSSSVPERVLETRLTKALVSTEKMDRDIARAEAMASNGTLHMMKIAAPGGGRLPASSSSPSLRLEGNGTSGAQLTGSTSVSSFSSSGPSTAMGPAGGRRARLSDTGRNSGPNAGGVGGGGSRQK